MVLICLYLTNGRWAPTCIATLPTCLGELRTFQSLPGSRLAIFYRNASSGQQMQLLNVLTYTFKKNLNASKPFEHPPSGDFFFKKNRWEHWLLGQKLFMVSKGFPNVYVGQQYNIGEKPAVIHVLTYFFTEARLENPASPRIELTISALYS